MTKVLRLVKHCWPLVFGVAVYPHQWNIELEREYRQKMGDWRGIY